MWHDIFYGILLGYGAAVPIGPMNLEMIRRNLLYGFKVGFSFGLGACLVDTCYIILLGIGILNILLKTNYFLKTLSICGALILLWFAYKAWTAEVKDLRLHEYQHSTKPWWRHLIDSYVLTMINPFTVIFWSSVSSQAALLVSQAPHAFWILAPSVLLATLSWVVGLNLTLYFTRDKISPRTMKFLNRLGALLLTLFAAYGLYQ